MSGKSRKQVALLHILEGNIPFIPRGSYQVYVYKTEIKGGSVELTARVISSNPVSKEERDEREENIATKEFNEAYKVLMSKGGEDWLSSRELSMSRCSWVAHDRYHAYIAGTPGGEVSDDFPSPMEAVRSVIEKMERRDKFIQTLTKEEAENGSNPS